MVAPWWRTRSRAGKCHRQPGSGCRVGRTYRYQKATSELIATDDSQIDYGRVVEKARPPRVHRENLQVTDANAQLAAITIVGEHHGRHPARRHGDLEDGSIRGDHYVYHCPLMRT